MSERMIELHRQKLGLPPAASAATPINNAATELQDEEHQMQRFLHRLQRRDDSHPAVASAVENPNMATSAAATGGPTVPTALARRMLQRQGVGYLDDTVAAITSASADRFLATVLQQAVACRDRRLEGAELAREAARQRKKHLQQYQADTDDRKRRKLERDAAHEKSLLTTIATAEALKKGGSSSAAAAAAAAAKNEADDKKKKTKKKKVMITDKSEDGAAATNGKKSGGASPKDDGGGSDEEMYDSVDEEEEYYQEQLGDAVTGITGDDEEDDDVLILRDLVRPLEAWKFHVTGKLGLEIRDNDADEIGEGTGGVEVDEAAADSTAAATAIPTEENGTDDGLFPAGGVSASAASAANGKSDSKQAVDDTDGGTNSTAKRKSAPSPVPAAT